MKPKFPPILANFIIILSLVACQDTPGPETASPSATAQAATLLPTFTPRPSPALIPSLTSRPTATIAPDMLIYLNQALDIIQSKSYFSRSVDWTVMRQFAYRLAAGSTNTYVTSHAISAVIQKLGDTHGYVWDPGQTRDRLNGSLDDQTIPAGKLLQGRLGLITVPGFGNVDQAKINEFATRVQQEIRKLDAHNPCGWVLDLSKNTGGSTFPMLAGVGPLLGDGISAYFEDADGKKYGVIYRDGKALMDNLLIAEVSGAAYKLKKESPPVAIITGPVTASAAELIAIAFRGRPNVRSFGQPTEGHATAIEGFMLSDGSLLGITTAIDLDRNGNAYGLTPITPDQLADLPQDGSVPQAAIDWLLSQPACH